MPPPASQVQAALQNFLDQFRGALRFRWIALIVAWCVALVLWAGIFFVPDTYEASARVFVNTRTTLSEATKGISLGDDIDAQIQRVREALLGVPQLEKVAGETNLLAGALTPEAKQSVIDSLQKGITITGHLPRGGTTAAVFTISYRNHSRAKSLQVVSHLLNDFVEGSLGGKREGSQQAQQFLTSQIADYAHRLSAAEQRLADFKKRNVGLMPQQQGDYFTRLQNETDGLETAKENLIVAQRKRDALKQQLRSGQPYIPGSAAASGGAAAPANDIESSIEQTQQQLNQLLLKFTDKYPDVVALRETLKELKARQKAAIAAARKGNAAAAASVGFAASPVYQKLEEQYNQSEVDIASMQQDISDREQRIAKLRQMMSAAPEVEAEFAQLTRNYDVTRKQYQDLLQRLDRAKLGEDAAATGIVTFQVIDPPTANFEPVEPKRPLLIAGALIAAIASGIGVAYLLQLVRPVFVSTRQLAAITGLQVLGAVSLAWFDRHHAEERRSGFAYAAWATGLIVIGIGVLLLQAHISHVVRELFA